MTRLIAALCLLLANSALAEQGFSRRADVRAFIAEMEQRHDMPRAELEAWFRQARHLPMVIKAIMPPRDPGVRSWQAYRTRFVEPRRIAAGRRFMARHAETLAAAEARFGVPPEIVAAIIGIETIYGSHVGRYGVFSALATLAFDYPPRAELFRRELEELLLLAREEGRSPLAYRGSYAGAIGLPQFLPSSRRRWGLDFDGDGRIDLGSSPQDAIGSVAHFLAAHGWQPGAAAAIAVTVDGNGIQDLLDAGIQPRQRPQEWVAAGLRLAGVGAGDTAPAAFPDHPAALIDLATPGAPTEYRIGYGNFYVITRYNRSSFYAAAVLDLAAELRRSEQ